MKPSPQEPHEQAISDAAEGEPSFDQLVASHQKRLYFFIRSMVYNPEDARDTLQDVNIVLYRKQQNYELGTNFKAWAFAVARFECLSYLARYKKSHMVALDSEILDIMAEKAEEKADDLAPQLDALRKCVLGLNEEMQFLIQSRYEQRTPLEAAAKQLQISIGAVKQKLFRARKQLKECISHRLRREKM